MSRFTPGHQPIIAAMLAACTAAPLGVHAAEDPALTQIRAELAQIRQAYENRIHALEQRVLDAEQRWRAAQVAPAAAAASMSGTSGTSASAPVAASAAPRSAPPNANVFNPEIGLVLNGTYARLGRDPATWQPQGFVPTGGEVGPGTRSFSLGESELVLSANIDPLFAGRVVAALGAEGEVGVEEAIVTTRGLSNGFTLKAGRFFSGIGYLNEQHRHTWDFVDAPLAYQAFFGSQYRHDGLQLRWLAPTERFFEIGLEAGNGTGFPGNDRNRNGAGATTLFAHLGDDLGVSSSWRAGLALLRAGAAQRSYADVDSTATSVQNAFTGRSRMLVADAVYKWAPAGNATRTSFKLQGEYFRRIENGTLTYDLDAASLGTATDTYRSAQSGWYLQGIYQFLPGWRSGLRLDRLNAGRTQIGLVDNGTLSAADFASLAPHTPTRTSLMFDYAPSEFSRVRLQLVSDRARTGQADKQIFIQYIMSLGAHKAHAF